MSLLHQTRFFTTVNDLQSLPEAHFYLAGNPVALPEVAFAGRSNAGKSTAINLLCNQKRLAYTSHTPGRTQHINYFQVGRPDMPLGFLVDLPGYGYAAVSKTAKEHWGKLLSNYLISRPQLRGLVLIMDARHPFTELDQQLLDWFSITNKPIQILLTKADKLTNQAQRQALEIGRTFLQENAWRNVANIQLFSSLKHLGITQATEQICQWLLPPDLPFRTSN